MADIAKEILAIRERFQKAAPPGGPTTFYCHGMEIPDEKAVEFFKGQNVVVKCRDGSEWLHGERLKPSSIKFDVTRLNEKIAAMDLPTCLERLQALTPEQKNVYLTGEWGRAEEGENDEKIDS